MRSGKLKLDGPWAQLRDPGELEAWLDELKACDWNVFIEGPPCGRSGPVTVLKYLARYLTGGPISDRRMIRDEDGRVWFWARGKDKQQGNPPRPFPLPGKEFVRRWAMHILPKGYTRARQFGGYHGGKRTSYLARCRELLSSSESAVAGATAPGAALGQSPDSSGRTAATPRCPRCDVPMDCLERKPRPSWKLIFERRIYEALALYSPMHHIHSRPPPASFAV